MLSRQRFTFCVLILVFATVPASKPQVINTRCILAEHPKHGRWISSKSTINHTPGQKVPSGTIINITCTNFYEPNTEQSSLICEEGKWSLDVKDIRCRPVCGTKPKPSSQNSNSYYPWNVVIYQVKEEKKISVCGGTLISERVVLTAANCLSDPLGQKNDPNLFKVAAGTNSGIYEDPEDIEAEYSDVEDIFFPEEYRGATSKYMADLGVVITKTPFNMSERIQPACLDWDNSFSKDIDYLTIKGYVPGPVKSPYFPRVKRVFEVEVPFANYSQCYNILGNMSRGADFRSFYTSDKICAGYINSDKSPMCRVDRGVGMVTKNANDNKYYVTAVASVFSSVFHFPDGCDGQLWILFTRLSKFMDFISEKSTLQSP